MIVEDKTIWKEYCVMMQLARCLSKKVKTASALKIGPLEATLPIGFAPKVNRSRQIRAEWRPGLVSGGMKESFAWRIQKGM